MKLDIRSMSFTELVAARDRLSGLLEDTNQQLADMRGIRNRHQENYEVWGPTRANSRRLVEKKQYLEAALAKIHNKLKQRRMEFQKCPNQ